MKRVFRSSVSSMEMYATVSLGKISLARGRSAKAGRHRDTTTTLKRQVREMLRAPTRVVHIRRLLKVRPYGSPLLYYAGTGRSAIVEAAFCRFKSGETPLLY